MPSLRHAIFDLDGTLVDSLPGIAWSVGQALALCGLPPLTVDLKPLIGPPIRSILASVTGLRDAPSLDRLERAFRASYDGEGWRKSTCYEGAPDMLRRLRAGGIGLWVVTNKPSRIARRILREIEIEGLFGGVASLDSRAPAYVSKAEALTDLVRRQGLSRTECLLVGDTLEDCNAAAAAAVACAIVPHGYGPNLPAVLPDNCRRVSGWDSIERLFEAEPASAAGSAGGTQEVNKHD
ncbi:MAG TPA: HAD hydrolase-like protein [Bryobacteraceae bacterium]|jgi:phosphoglycolate phosphatase